MVLALCTSGVGLKSFDEIEEHLLRPNLCTSPFVSFTSELIKLYQHFTCGFFVKKVSHAAILYLHFRFVLFWCKNISAKAVLRILVN